MLADGLYQPGDDHEQDDKQIIIGHLHMVRVDLKGREDSRDQQSPQVSSPIGQYHTGNHRRQIGQCPDLPDMSGGDDNQEIGRERPDDRAERRQMLSEVESPQQDIESQQVHEHIPHVLWQPQVIGINHLRQQVGRAI